MLENEVVDISEFTIIDTSCGYGSFFDYNYKLKPKRIIGGDIDEKAIQVARMVNKNIEYYQVNALKNVSRENYNISKTEKLIIIGNPPYNDVTSKVKMSLKKGTKFKIDNNIKTRDLGISFLLSYSILSPDYICVLHPLSYIIK